MHNASMKDSKKVWSCRFLSFSRVGTGLSVDELDAVVTKLKPYFRYFLDNLNT